MITEGSVGRPLKLETPDLLRKLMELPIRYTMHAIERLEERKMLQAHVSQMLRGKTGQRIHDASKDQFENGSWKYRIHGTDIDGSSIGVAVAIAQEVVVVTVFRQSK